MVHKPGPTSELARDLRVRVEPLKVAEFKLDCGILYSGKVRDVRKEMYSVTSEAKGPDRSDRARLISNSWLVLIPDQPDGSYSVILVGTGIADRDPVFTAELGMSSNSRTDTSGRVDATLKKFGIKRDSVDHVILPSLDFLSSANLILQDNRGDREPICGNAEYVIHRAEYDTVMAARKSTTDLYRGIKSELCLLQSRLRHQHPKRDITVFDSPEIKIGEFVRVVHHGGATPGYCSVYVTINSETLVLSNLFFPTVSHMTPGVQIGIGYSRNETFEAKENLLEECWKNQYIVLFPHDPGLTAGYVQPTRGGYALEKVGDILH